MSDVRPYTPDSGIDLPKRSPFTSLMSKPAVFGSLIPIVTLLNAVVGMILPQMMDPHSFGEYSLVVTLFNYGLIFDFGISQVIDRQIPAHLGLGEDALAQSLGDKLVWLRLYIGVAMLAISAGALCILARANLLPFNLAAGMLAALAGLADMVALGPACIYRARSARRDYAIAIAILLSGLIVARLTGLIVAGLIGCFAALAIWYVVFAVVFNRRFQPSLHSRPSGRESWSLIRFGVPFFATSFIWAFYVTGNRWIASMLIDPTQFGHFAFSANIFSLLVGAIGGFSAFYYPRIAEKIASNDSFAVSALLRRDLCFLVLGLSAIIGVSIVLAGIMVGFVYPQYTSAVDSARVILVAVPAMALASWLMPVSLSGGGRPLVDGVVIYPIATAILIVAMNWLYQYFGDNGAAAASTVSAVPLIGMQLVWLRYTKIIRTADVGIIMACCCVVSLWLGLLAWGFIR